MHKVLLVEDDTTMLSLLKTLLTMEGFQVAAIAPDERNVADVVGRECPDLLLLDVHLKHQHGLDVLEELRAKPEYKDLRIVMTSGANVESECLQKGANAFLMKPYMPDDLVSVLKNNLA